MERVGRWLLQNWKGVAGVLFFGLVAGLIVAGLIYIPKWQSNDIRSLVSLPREESLKPDKLTAKEYFEIENEARKTLAQIVGGVLVLAGIIIAYWRQTTAEETLRVTERGQITDRFTRAIEQLGKQELQLQLGAIYALEKIARDSENFHWQVMEVLTAYVRDKYPWKKGVEPTRGENVPLDLEAIMTVLRRRKHERERPDEGQTINLDKTDLRKVNLANANLKWARFVDANLQEAKFYIANLQKAWFGTANLHWVQFDGTDLQEAQFDNANLHAAMFNAANLQGAHFSGANLKEACFNTVNLQAAWFDAVKLQDATLIMADLRWAKYLEQDNIDSARCSEDTILPEGLNNVKALENWKKYQDSLKQRKE